MRNVFRTLDTEPPYSLGMCPEIQGSGRGQFRWCSVPSRPALSTLGHEGDGTHLLPPRDGGTLVTTHVFSSLTLRNFYKVLNRGSLAASESGWSEAVPPSFRKGSDESSCKQRHHPSVEGWPLSVGGRAPVSGGASPCQWGGEPVSVGGRAPVSRGASPCQWEGLTPKERAPTLSGT